MPRNNGAKPKGRQRHYTGPERLGYMLLALQTSTEQVAAEHHIPARTIRFWFEEAGGIAECRRWLEEEMVSAYVRSRQGIFTEGVKGGGGGGGKGLRRGVISSPSPNGRCLGMPLESTIALSRSISKR